MSKLKQFSALAAVLIAGQKAGETQIVYTNIDPDIILEPDPALHEYKSYALDINNNGIDDFVIYNYASLYSGWSGSTNYFKVAGIQPNEHQAIAGTEGDALAFKITSIFTFGEEIGDVLNWYTEPVAVGQHIFGILAKKYTFDDNFIGKWENKSGKFAALKIMDGGSEFYGWVRLSVTDESTQVIIHDYAYNSTPGNSIFSGETGLDCNAPFPLSPVIISPTQIKLKWQPLNDAVMYKVYYREIGAPSWIIKTATAPKTSKIISGLDCNAEYEWKLKASCDGGTTFSDFSDIKTFTTDACRQAEVISGIQEVQVFPNPAVNTVIIDLSMYTEKSQVEIYDLNGNLIRSIYAEPENMYTIDVSDLINGTYLVKISGKNDSIMKKLIKM